MWVCFPDEVEKSKNQQKHVLSTFFDAFNIACLEYVLFSIQEKCRPIGKINFEMDSYSETPIRKRNNRAPRIFELKGKTLIILCLLLYDSNLWDIRVYHAKN